MKEWIKIAAVRTEDGQVYTGMDHSIAISRACDERKSRPIGKHEQGFLTSTGRFVDREEGGRIAIEARQISRLQYSESELFSEELRFTDPEYGGAVQVIREIIMDMYENSKIPMEVCDWFLAKYAPEDHKTIMTGKK